VAGGANADQERTSDRPLPVRPPTRRVQEAARAHRPNSRLIPLPNDCVIGSEIVSDSFLDIEAPETAQFS